MLSFNIGVETLQAMNDGLMRGQQGHGQSCTCSQRRRPMSAGRPAGRELLPAILPAPARTLPKAPSPLRASAPLLVAPASPSPSPLFLRLNLLHASFLDRDLLLGFGPLLTLTAAWLRSWRLLGGFLLC